jgi:hypothetical protein
MTCQRMPGISGNIVVAIAIAILALAGNVASWTDVRAQPAIGDEVLITDATGNEVGTIVIEGVEDPFEDYREGYEPAEDARYVLLAVAFEATGDEPLEADPNDLVLRDANGFHWQTATVYREEDDPRPDLQSQTMASGNRISGVVGFQVPETAELTHVYYQPENSRLIEVALLQDDPVSGPALGVEVPYESVEVAGAEGIIVVSELEDPFDDLAEGYEPAEDARYVLMTVSFEATGDAPFDADPYDLILRDGEGFLWATASVPRAEESPPDLQSQTMAPGNRISGVVGFQIPEDAELAELFWQPESGRLVLLTDFQIDAGDSASDKDLNSFTDDGDATAEAEEDEGETAGAGGIDGNVYTSPTYGFSISWDEDLWEVGSEKSADGVDSLVLVLDDEDGHMIVGLKGHAAGGDPERCLEDMVDRYEDLEGEIFIEGESGEMTPIVGGDGEPARYVDEFAAAAVYKFRVGERGSSAATYVRYLECRALVPGEAVLEIHELAIASSYDAHVDEMNVLLRAIDIPVPGEEAEEAAVGVDGDTYTGWSFASPAEQAAVLSGSRDVRRSTV